MTPRTLWRIGTYGPPVMLATLTAPALVVGDSPFSAFAVLCSAAVVWLYASRLRPTYKNGWHDGRVSLVTDLAAGDDGGNGALAPEPWAPPGPASGVIVRRRATPEADGP